MYLLRAPAAAAAEYLLRHRFNDGQAALLALKASGASAVYAFEANPEIHALHHARLSAGGVRYLNLALSDQSGETTVFAPRTFSNTGRLKDWSRLRSWSQL